MHGPMNIKFKSDIQSRNTYRTHCCVCIATVVTPTCNNVTSYVHCLVCL